MKKLILAALASLMVFSTVGCTPEIIRAGAERDMALYSSKIAMEATRVNIPACRLTAREGTDIVLSGVESFECYGGGGRGGDAEITQRVSPIWNFLAQNSGILGMLGFSALMFPNGLNPAPATIAPEIVTTPNPLVVRPEVINPVVVRP